MKDTIRIPVPDKWKDLKPHPFAMLTPYGVGIDTARFALRMCESGYDPDKPIVLFEDLILDGGHRHVAAQEAGVIPNFEVYVGDDPGEFVTRKNLVRQHFTESQRAALLAALNLARGGQGPTIAHSAGKSDVTEPTTTDAVNVAAEGGAKLQDQVGLGQAAVQVAALATRSVFCERCQKSGPTKGCKKCEALRVKSALATYRKPRPKKPPKISEKFDWKKFDRNFDALVRGIAEIHKAYGGDEEYAQCRALLERFRTVFESWKQRVTRMNYQTQ